MAKFANFRINGSMVSISGKFSMETVNEELEKTRQAIDEEDQKYKLLSRVLRVIAVFAYYAAILQVQLSLGIEYCKQESLSQSDLTECREALAPYNVWLVIEVVSFYLTILEVTLYIAVHMIRQEFNGAVIQDIRKEVTDFLLYSQD